MRSITIHSIDDFLYSKIKNRAIEERNSMNKTVKKILAGAMGQTKDAAADRKKDFMDIFGKWSKEELADFEKNLEETRKIDMEDWK
jgi:hypothetical protein